MSHQPEALRLADWHKAMADEPKRNEAKRDKHRRTEAELRRLADIELSFNVLLNQMYGMTVKAALCDKELLDALRHLEHNARKSGAEMGLAIDVARAAIAKAQGEMK